MRLTFLAGVTGDGAACHRAPDIFNPQVLAEESVTAELDGRRLYAHGQVTQIEGDEQAILAWLAGRTLWVTDNPMLGWRRIVALPATVPERQTISREVFVGRTGVEPEKDDLERCNCKQAGQMLHFSCGWNIVADAPVFMVGPNAVEPIAHGSLAHV